MHNSKELLEKGLIPEYVTVEQMSKIMNSLPVHIVKEQAKSGYYKPKKLDTGEIVVSTLILLESERDSDEQFSKEQKQRRVRYLKRLMKKSKA